MNNKNITRISDAPFEDHLQESAKVHGHLCPGQVLGVRMSLLGLAEIGIESPTGRQKKDLIVFVEMDRCATDAVQSVTGCSLGHRTLKFMDYGKMAATFMNIKSGKAIRIVAREQARQTAKEYFPRIGDTYAGQVEAYKIMQDNELFDVMEVIVRLSPENMPGRPLRRVPCEACGEYVQDMREIYRDGNVLCVSCAEGGYFTRKEFF